MKNPDEVVEMVEKCSTEQLEELLKVEPIGFYGIMVKLAVQYEYNQRQNNILSETRARMLDENYRRFSRFRDVES